MKRAVIYLNDGRIDWVDPVEDVREEDNGDLIINNGAFTYIYERADYKQYEVVDIEEEK